MIITKQFIISTTFALITHSVYFIVAAQLDKYINSEIANVIGLTVDLILDFIVQQYVFMKKVFFNKAIITRYIISESLILFANQLIFTIYNRNFYTKKHNLTIVRGIIGVLIYTFLVFPLRKYFIYK
tara:strand:+ start:10407 stop:10787 length:381 start_codon:yes stop_codon:yes gene_type:complete